MMTPGGFQKSRLIVAMLTGFYLCSFAYAGHPLKVGQIVDGEIYNIINDKVTILTKDGRKIDISRAQVGRRLFRPGEKIRVYLKPSQRVAVRSR